MVGVFAFSVHSLSVLGHGFNGEDSWSLLHTFVWTELQVSVSLPLQTRWVEREWERERQKEKETETERGRDRETERERERKASKGIRNDVEVEHTSFFVANRIGISGVWKNYRPCCPNIFSKPDHWSIHISERQTDCLLDLNAKEEGGREETRGVIFSIS